MSIYYEESGYLKLLEDVIRHGEVTPDRTGVGCKKLFDVQLRFDLGNGYAFPCPTVRKTPLRIAFEEFWFFLSGSTQTKALEDKNVNIWKGNTSREFLDNRGLSHLEEGDMGKAYGYQLRNYGGTEYDQIKATIEGLKSDPYSRRHYVTMWNPSESSEMALTPCYHSHQFKVRPGPSGMKVLDITVFSRSADLLYGCPFNYQQYALYLLAVAKCCSMYAGTLTLSITDAHIYNNQLEYAKETLHRTTYGKCKVGISKFLSSWEDVVNLQWQDIQVFGHKVNESPYRTPKPPMAV